ncbi:GNAT family N-acetyltransferase [Scopulibacillus cellulosilyticus]|uniref:GNAT family N-acetyltransferase n=1 Tax=Scopulibacillus cellulosilyticus TaxID=2665665 RepID=A0ABW2PWF3_9BACL
MTLQIREVNSNNWRIIAALSVSKDQHAFIESNSYSLVQSKYHPEWKSVAIYDGNTPVGYCMYGTDIEKNQIWLDRFMIDQHYQGKGYGKQAIPLLIDCIVETYQCDRIYLSIHPENFAAQKLYESFGFKLTEEMDFGEAVMVFDT